MANEAKQFTIGGVTHDVMDVGARQAIASLQNAIDAITSGDTTTAIKTFQEVINFLDGVTDDATLIGKLNELRTLISAKYSKPVNGIPASDLADGVIPDVSGFATKTEVNAKANSADVYSKTEVDTKVADAGKVKSVSVNGGTAQTPDGNGNVNVVVQTVVLDDAPTAGSNNAVKSGGIRTALDNLLANLRIVNNEWYIGNTATGVSAQGSAGNVNITDASQLVTILVNDLTTGGAGNILSAEMGKVLKTAVQTLIDSMGEYCFPNGRPTLSWEGAKCNVTQNLTDVTSNFTPSRVDKNGSLEITLSPVDNLHVFLTGDVTVEMPLGNDITSAAWNESTGKVTIADVADDVVITAKSSTYVQSGLVLMFDGKNQGSEATKWVDLANSSRKLSLNGGYTKNSDHITFDGSSAYGIIDDANLDVKYDTGSLEAIYSQSSFDNNYHLIAGSFMRHGTALAMMKAAYAPYSSDNRRVFIGCFLSSADSGTAPSGLVSALLDNSSNQFVYAANEVVLASHCGNNFYLNNEQMSLTDANKANVLTTSADHNVGDLYVGGNINGSGNTTGFFPGNIYCVRLYSKVLTDTERAQNYKVDKKRFNIA